MYCTPIFIAALTDEWINVKVGRLQGSSVSKLPMNNEDTRDYSRAGLAEIHTPPHSNSKGVQVLELLSPLQVDELGLPSTGSLPSPYQLKGALKKWPLTGESPLLGRGLERHLYWRNHTGLLPRILAISPRPAHTEIIHKPAATPV